MDKAKMTPKDFFLWCGGIIALYLSIWTFIALIFDYLDYLLPDSLNRPDPYLMGISLEMAVLLVLSTFCLILFRTIKKLIREDTTRANIAIRRWALYLTLFVAGATVAVDLIILMTTFLNGQEFTIRFLLKSLLVLLVAGGVFLYFFADLRNHWEENKNISKLISFGVYLFLLASVMAGFFIIGSPQQARLYQVDRTKMYNLMELQSQIEYYYNAKKKLPAKLDELNNQVKWFSMPLDPQSRQLYEYKGKDLTYELCAVFSLESRPQDRMHVWSHDAGRNCFERKIDPERYKSNR